MPRPKISTQLTALKILAVHIRNLKLAARRRGESGSDIEPLHCRRIKFGHGVAGFGLAWLPPRYRAALPCVSKCTTRICADPSRDKQTQSHLGFVQCPLQLIGQALTVKEVITEHKATGSEPTKGRPMMNACAKPSAWAARLSSASAPSGRRRQQAAGRPANRGRRG